MQAFSLKKSMVLLLSLWLPMLGKAEDSSAPAKFYDGLQIPTNAAPSPKYYIVKVNESLSAIAARYGYNYVKLAQWNDIPAPYSVISGQRLKLFDDKKIISPKQAVIVKVNDDSPIETDASPPKYYVVKANESLSAIAARYGYNYVKLARWNDIPAPYNVINGQRLKLFHQTNTVADKNIATIHRQNEDLLEQELERATASANHEELAAKKSVRKQVSAVNAASDTDLNPGSRIKSAPDINDSNLVEYYVVEKNESLSEIALRFKVASEQLAAWNGITSPNQLYAGQKLKIFKNKQKHSFSKSSKKQPETAEIPRDNSQKTSIISINNKSMLKFYCHWPTKGKVIKKFSQTGGRGIEIAGKTGQTIKAAAAGKIVAVSPGIYGHGGFIVIQHSDLILTSYANNRRSLVKNGQLVTQDEVIAEMGQVGHKSPSLEFEIRHNGKVVDPMRFLPKKI